MLAAVVLLGLGAAPAGWVVSDRLEQDDDFCNACHLETPAGAVPLHIDVRRDFDRAAPPETLAGVHGLAQVESRPDDPAFRCIDCHGGASFVGKARVKMLAAKDALVYAFGTVEEPSGMGWPLWDEDCAQCHERFAPRAGAPGTPAFHELAVHNTDMPVRCVDCHFVHDRGGNPDAYFLHAAPVRAQCARCHPEFEQ